MPSLKVKDESENTIMQMQIYFFFTSKKIKISTNVNLISWQSLTIKFSSKYPMYDILIFHYMICCYKFWEIQTQYNVICRFNMKVDQGEKKIWQFQGEHINKICFTFRGNKKFEPSNIAFDRFPIQECWIKMKLTLHCNWTV